MSKHTPGPWQVERFLGGRHKWAIGPDVALRVCDAYSEADARLIAAAPDLLETLKTLAVFLPSDHPEPADNERIQPGFIYIRWGDLRAARAAIAKATEAA